MRKCRFCSVNFFCVNITVWKWPESKPAGPSNCWNRSEIQTSSALWVIAPPPSMTSPHLSFLGISWMRLFPVKIHHAFASAGLQLSSVQFYHFKWYELNSWAVAIETPGLAEHSHLDWVSVRSGYCICLCFQAICTRFIIHTHSNDDVCLWSNRMIFFFSRTSSNG